MEKRLVIAVALSILIIISFQYFAGRHAALKGPQVAPASIPEKVTTSSPAEVALPKEHAVEEETEEIVTDKYVIELSNIGGAIKSIQLKDYKATKSEEPFTLVNILNPKEYIYATTGTIGSFRIDTAAYEIRIAETDIVCTLKTKDFELVKKYTLSNNKYGIELHIIVKNLTNAPLELNYKIIGGSGLTESDAQDKRFIEAVSNVDGKFIGFKRPKDAQIINQGIVGWVAAKNKYFSIIIKPFLDTNNAFYSDSKDGYLASGIQPKEIALPPGSFVDHKYILYAGPGQAKILRNFGFGFEETITYGFFGWIAKALILITAFFYSVMHNWGVAIILLALFLNIILFPLSSKSFKSMQKMQELHPQMEKLKTQYKDSPQKLNKEIMELYKKYNINPFSGCLPLLLQMPIFIALYQALSRSIELRSSSFLWISDLSMPEAVPIPITLPIIGNTINILPIIMVIAMVVQQKISTKSMGGAVTEEQKQQQKMMLILMPIMFGFIFYNMPSGLVLYWLVNTLMTIGEQYFIFKKT